jgi:transcriptional regulator with GAF, ATPase, and Fis domain/serine/threonine protein kinase
MVERIGRYLVLELLGEGAQARVFLGRDELRGDEVVLKEVRPGHEEALRREYRILASLHHPNVIQARDLLTQDGRPVLVEQRAGGEDLVSWARSEPEPGRISQGFAAALRGVCYVHTQGVIHRDLKPDCLRVGGGSIGRLPAVRLLDFGLAHELPAPAETAGTLEYAAPEVKEGRRATPASDLFSLGVVLFEALCGRLPVAPVEPPEGPFRELLRGLLDPDPSRRPDVHQVTAALEPLAGCDLGLSAGELAGEYLPWPPLVGREAALRQLEEWLRGAERGAVHVCGAGKTSVVRRVCALARLDGMEVAVVNSSRDLLRLVEPPIAHDDPERLATHFADQLLARQKKTPPRERGAGSPLSKARGLLLCLDGLEPIDAPGAALASQMARMTGNRPDRLVVLWAADWTPSELLLGRTVQLEPLDPDEAHQLVRRMLWHLPDTGLPPWVGDAPALTGGDPRLLAEVVRSRVGLPGEPEVSELEAMVESRIAAFDPDERRLLGVIALSPVPVPQKVLTGPAPELSGALGRLLERGLLSAEAGGEVAPAGLAVRSVARALIEGEGGAAAVHAAYVDAWREAGVSDPAVLGHHLLGAGRPEEGARALLEATVVEENDLELAAEALAPLTEHADIHDAVLERWARAARARGALDVALEVAETLGEVNPVRGLLLQAELLTDAGQGKLALKALDLHPDAGGARPALLRARAHFLLGDYAAAAAIGEEAGADAPGVDELSLANLTSLSLVYLGRLEQGLARADRALEAARELSGGKRNHDPLARLLNSRGIALQRLGRHDEARAAYAECLELAGKLRDLRFAATSALNLGTLAQGQLDLSGALEHFERSAALARRAGVATTEALALANEANLRLLVGDLDGAEQRIDAALETALRPEVGARTIAGHAHLYRGELLMARVDLPGARDCLERARGAFEDGDAIGRLGVDILEGELLLREGRLDQARDAGLRLLSEMGADEPERWRAHLLVGEASIGGPGGTLHLGLALAHARETGGEWLFYVHALLARALAQTEPTVTGEVMAHAERSRALLEELRQRVPLSLREAFDANPRVVRALRATKSLPRTAPAGEPTSGELARLLEINKELNQNRSVEVLLARILDCAIELTGAERGFAIVDEGGRLRVAAARNVDQESVRRGMKKFSRTIARMSMDEDRPVVASDAMDDQRFGERLSIHGLKLRAVLCVPLRAGDRKTGALYVDNRFTADAFNERHVLLMRAFADQAGIALEAARLLSESAEHREALARAKEELEALNHQLEAKVSRQAEELSEISVRLRSQEEELVRRYNAARLVGRSKPMRELFLQIDRLAEASLPVFIWGASGTGKELVARAIHYTSGRRQHPFVTINCGAIPATLLESELFGHVRGAFTGALRDRPGLFEVAGEGTLFLDEVGDMPPDMQAKLLRVLQESTFRRLGDEKERTSRCRVLSASLHRLADLVAKGRFREDLYYRLNVVELAVPPLRDRREDIPLLVEHLLQKSEHSVEVSTPAMAALCDYDWPGNVRQLENELQRAALLCEEGVVRLGSLSPELQPSISDTKEPATLQQAMDKYEKRLIEQTLLATDHNITKASEQLGVHRMHLYRKLRKHGLKQPAGT